MITTRHDPDTTSTTEGVALANCAALGIVILLNGPTPWPAVRGASVVIMYAFAMSVALNVAARAGARAAMALAFLGTVAGSIVAVPYVVRTGISPTGAVGLFTIASSVATAALALVPRSARTALLLRDGRSSRPTRSSRRVFDRRTPWRSRVA